MTRLVRGEHRVFGRHDLAQRNGPRFAHQGNAARIRGRSAPRVDHRSAFGGEIFRIDDVFHRERHTMQRRTRRFAIGARSLGERELRIEMTEGTDLSIARFNALEAGRSEMSFPWLAGVWVRLCRILPWRIRAWLNRSGRFTVLDAPSAPTVRGSGKVE